MKLNKEIEIYNKRLDNYHLLNIPDKTELLNLVNVSKIKIYEILNKDSWVEVFKETWKQKFEIKEFIQKTNYI